MKSPSVFLIGVGPGDPDLITVRGRDCLPSADVVIHDQEVNKLILNQAQPDAEVRYFQHFCRVSHTKFLNLAQTHQISGGTTFWVAGWRKVVAEKLLLGLFSIGWTFFLSQMMPQKRRNHPK